MKSRCLPDLNEGRQQHSSCTTRDFAFVFCGFVQSNKYERTETIEKLELRNGLLPKRKTWTTFSVPGLNRRNNPLVMTLDPSKILFFGGHSINSKDGLILSVRDVEITERFKFRSAEPFLCIYNQYCVSKRGTVYAIVDRVN